MLLAVLRDAVRSLDLTGRAVLVAVSGGIDSTVLAHGLSRLAAESDLRLCLGHVHHGLRAGEADADAAAVQALAAKLGLGFGIRHVDPRAARAGHGSRTRPTLQEAARDLRYAALDELADESGASRIATAHTADDQAETVLLRLLRGTGPDGLAGIPARSRDGRVVRPLLAVERAEVAAYAAEHALRWREDPSNSDPRYARSRLRGRWLPGLAREFNPKLLRAIAQMAEAQSRDSEWIRSEVEREAARRFAWQGASLWIEASGWRELPDALSRRLARELLVRCGSGRDVSRRHIERVLDFLRNGSTGKAIEVPGGWRLERTREGFWLRSGFVRPPDAC